MNVTSFFAVRLLVASLPPNCPVNEPLKSVGLTRNEKPESMMNACALSLRRFPLTVIVRWPADCSGGRFEPIKAMRRPDVRGNRDVTAQVVVDNMADGSVASFREWHRLKYARVRSEIGQRRNRGIGRVRAAEEHQRLSSL